MHPLYKITEQLQSHFTTLLRMKLCAPYMFSHDHAAIGRTIIRNRRHPLLILRLHIIGVSEIKIGLAGNTIKDSQVFTQWRDLVPAHMGNLWTMRYTLHSSAKETQSIDLALGMVISQ